MTMALPFYALGYMLAGKEKLSSVSKGKAAVLSAVLLAILIPLALFNGKADMNNNIYQNYFYTTLRRSAELHLSGHSPSCAGSAG